MANFGHFAMFGNTCSSCNECMWMAMAVRGQSAVWRFHADPFGCITAPMRQCKDISHPNDDPRCAQSALHTLFSRSCDHRSNVKFGAASESAFQRLQVLHFAASAQPSTDHNVVRLQLEQFRAPFVEANTAFRHFGCVVCVSLVSDYQQQHK